MPGKKETGMSDDVVYVSFEGGAVHSCTREHYEHVLCQKGGDGKFYPRPGVETYTEAEARKLNGPLFGLPDPRVEEERTDEEIEREFIRQENLARRKRQLDKMARGEL